MEYTRVSPDLKQVLDEFKNNIFANLYCMLPGKITKFDKSSQTAEVQLQVKRRIADEIKSYPVLVDCPVFYLQGGGAYIDMPVKKDDYCIVIFADRNIDTWWSSANEKEPPTLRKHDLSDGFVIVGINPKTSTLSIDGEKVRIMCKDKEFHIKEANKIELLGATEEFVKGNTLCTAFTTLCSTIATATSGTNAQNAAGIETIKTAFSNFNSQISNFKSHKIKGE